LISFAEDVNLYVISRPLIPKPQFRLYVIRLKSQINVINYVTELNLYYDSLL
jgi:hypothetical protein